MELLCDARKVVQVNCPDFTGVNSDAVFPSCGLQETIIKFLYSAVAIYAKSALYGVLLVLAFAYFTHFQQKGWANSMFVCNTVTLQHSAFGKQCCQLPIKCIGSVVEPFILEILWHFY